MKPHRQGTKPADPLLEEGRQKDKLRPFGVPRWLGALLYALFWFVLVIPLVRRFRRRPAWNAVRLVAGVAGVGLAVWAATEGPTWLWAPALLCGLITLVGRTADPDAERKLQRRHQAEYLLNGGRFVEGRLPNAEPVYGDLYLLIRGEHVLLVPRKSGEVHSAIAIRSIEKILVDGERYVPVYISEAKDPPVKAESPIAEGEAELQLSMDSGETLRFRYVGAFRKHLAETAAHGIHSVRERLLRPQPTELSRMIH